MLHKIPEMLEVSCYLVSVVAVMTVVVVFGLQAVQQHMNQELVLIVERAALHIIKKCVKQQYTS